MSIMLNGTFRGLWNKALLLMGALWALLVFMIWESNQLETAGDRLVFLTVVISGFLVIYFSGFVIEVFDRKKKTRGS